MYELTSDVFPPSNFAVFNCCYILCYWLQRVETCTNCIDKQALLIFEPNWCIRLHLLRVKSCANEKKCKQWSHNESAPAAAYDRILQFLYPGYQRFFSRVWRGASSAAGRHVFSLRPKTRAAKPREKTFRAGHFLRLDRNRKPRMKSLWHPGYMFSIQIFLSSTMFDSTALFFRSRLSPSVTANTRFLEEDVVLSGCHVPARVSIKTESI